MSKGNKTEWKGIEQLKNDPSFVKNAQNEFPEFLPIKGSSDNSRRDFEWFESMWKRTLIYHNEDRMIAKLFSISANCPKFLN